MPKALLSSALFAALVAMPLSGCDDDDVGIQCEGGSGSGPSESSGLEISQSLQCRSRLCITDGESVNPIPRCTRVCSNDGDCPNEGPNCSEGFLCRVGTRVSILGLQCCKLCLCKDDLSQAERERDELAEKCKDQNIEAKCPSI